MRIRDIMSDNVVAVDEKTSIHDARKIMDAHKIRRLPVMKKDKIRKEVDRTIKFLINQHHL